MSSHMYTHRSKFRQICDNERFEQYILITQLIQLFIQTFKDF